MARGLAACLTMITACAGDVQVAVNVVPPAPVEAAVTSEAPEPAPPSGDADAAVDAAPAEPPEAQLSGDALVLKRDIVFDRSGALDPVSAPALDAVAALLAKHADIDALQIGVELWGGQLFDKKGASETRAKALRDALVERGVASERLVTRGHGDSCRKEKTGDEQVAVALLVIERGGQATGAPRGCAGKP